MAGRVAVLTAALLLSAACGGDDDASGDTTSTTTTAVAPTTAPAPAVTTYEVQRGDTLSAIAQRFGTTVDALVAANGLADPDVLAVGQVLAIPTGP